ncbi:hypothetical protein LSTR_LSTR013953 [Laodelphax striatellus]|uniref:Uncharacterized protein n=1 Tax=Laodelphax striatellus TaxID=195883 RepID=A0A482XFB3_LAOST|nr:hypothetical protein LSTR_LSTR013953 [Laodelphax striatellus]
MGVEAKFRTVKLKVIILYNILMYCPPLNIRPKTEDQQTTLLCSVLEQGSIHCPVHYTGCNKKLLNGLKLAGKVSPVTCVEEGGLDSDVENDKNIILCNALLLSESVLGFLPASQLVWDGDDSRNKSYLLSHWYAGSFVFVTSTLAERERDGRIREWSRRRVMVDEDEKEESPWKKREKTVKREERERE